MFENVKVLSFTHFLQGPAALQMLADLRAEQIERLVAEGLVRDGAQVRGKRDAAD